MKNIEAYTTPTAEAFDFSNLDDGALAQQAASTIAGAMENAQFLSPEKLWDAHVAEYAALTVPDWSHDTWDWYDLLHVSYDDCVSISIGWDG